MGRAVAYDLRTLVQRVRGILPYAIALALSDSDIATAQVRYAVTSTSGKFTPAGISREAMIGGSTNEGYAWDAIDGVMAIPGFAGPDANVRAVSGGCLVVGSSHLSPQGGPVAAFVWDKAHGTREVADFGCQSEAWAVNNMGDIAGILDNPPDGVAEAPFLWKSGHDYVRLPPLVAGGSSGAEFLNDRDEVVGAGLDAFGVQHAVIWSPNGTMTDMGNMPGQYENDPAGINDSGLICGYSFGYLSGTLSFVSYIWSPASGYMPLYNPFNATYSIYAVGINNNNAVVGRLDGTHGETEGFVWNQATGFTMINDNLDPGSSGWNITEVDGINDAGQMAGVGTLNGQQYAVLITPTGTEPVSGTVTLGNYPAGPNGVLVTVQLYDSGTTALVDSQNTTLDPSGSFTIQTGAPAGTYDVYVKASHWLRRRLANQTLGASGMSGLKFSLINGDINGDNTISLADLGQLKQAYGSVLWNSNWNPNADLDGNGSVGLSDFGILKLNYGTSGD